MRPINQELELFRNFQKKAQQTKAASDAFDIVTKKYPDSIKFVPLR